LLQWATLSSFIISVPKLNIDDEIKIRMNMEEKFELLKNRLIKL